MIGDGNCLNDQKQWLDSHTYNVTSIYMAIVAPLKMVSYVEVGLSAP